MNKMFNKKNAAFSAFIITLLGASLAQAADGGQVTAGSGAITQTGTTTTITQQSQNLAIDWNTFSIAANETVRFNQPNASSIALNRVLSANPSQIFGSLSANGQIFLLNPNGVLFGRGAQVNVGGLVATTLNLSNADFMAGKHTFSAQGQAGSVVNQGTLSAAEQGYIALLAPQVLNEGVITATLGTALLAAGNKVTLNLINGSLLSYSIDQGALDALAQNSQLIQADGGQVFMSAIAADALSKAVVNNSGIIEARTLYNKNGVIKLLGDMQVGQVNVGGTLDASAPNGGNGGFIDTSAAHVKVADTARVSTLAANGNNGMWLIDPTDYYVSATGPTDGSSWMSNATLSTNLGLGNITIQTLTTGTGNGDIFVDSAVNWSSANTLTLNAIGHVNVNAAITSSGSGKLVMRADMNASGVGTINFGTGIKVTLSGGGRADLYYNPTSYSDATTKSDTSSNPYSTKITGTYTAWMLVNSVANLQAMNTNLAGKYALGKDLNADGVGFTPVGSNTSPFTGNFDGLGRTISNLTVNLSTTSYVGLFGYTANGSTIKNVGLLGGSMNGVDYVGGLVGHNNGMISNSFTRNSVTGNSFVGGLVGYNTGTINDISFADSSVSGSSEVGGLAGYNSGAISNTTASGSVTGSNNVVGGLVGFNNGSINKSSASGTVTGSKDYVGGLVGTNYGSIGTLASVTYATGNVTGASFVGGLVGYNVSGTIIKSYATGTVNGSNAGGLVGVNDSSVANAISFSYANGNVNGSTNIGGLVGINYGNISKSYATGNVNGSTFVGGLVGYNTKSIITTYSTGLVTGTSSAGGLVGSNNGGTITSSYWDTTTSSQTVSAGGTGYTTAAMKTKATFAAAWGNNNIADTGGTTSDWRIYNGDSYPLLATFLQQGITITANDAARIFNGSPQTGGAGIDPISGILIAVDEVTGADRIVYDVSLQGITNAGETAPIKILSGVYSDQQGPDILSFVDGTMTISPATVTITAKSLSKIYDGIAYAVGSDGVEYRISGVVTTDTSMLSGTLTYGGSADGAQNVGIYSITANGQSSSSGNYIVSYVDGVLTVTPYIVNLSGSRTYDGKITVDALVYAASLLSGLVGSETLNIFGSGTMANKHYSATSKTVTLGTLALADGTNGGLASNYSLVGATITINKASLAIDAQTDTKNYDGTPNSSAAVQVTGLMSADGDSITPLAQTFDSKNAGPRTLSVLGGYTINDGNNGDNYAVTESTASGTINKIGLTVTAYPKGKVFGDSDPNPITTVEYIGFVNGEYTGVLTGVLLLTRTAGEGIASANSTYDILYTGSTLASDNYTISYTAAPNMFTIYKVGELLIQMGGSSAIYGVNPASLPFAPIYARYNNGTIVNTGFGPGVVDLLASASISGNIWTLKDAGVDEASFTANTNYVSGGDVGIYAINTGIVTRLNNSSSYTTIKTEAGNLTVTPRAVDLTPNKVYDGTTAITTIDITNQVGSDDVSITGFGTYENKNAATGGKNYTLSNLTLSGAKKPNYFLSVPSGTNGIITKAPLNIDAVSDTKTYNGTTASAGAVSIGTLFGSDNVTGSTQAFDSKDAGARTLSVTGYTINDGNGGNNYAVTSNTASGTINKATLIISANADNETYSGLAYSGGNGVEYAGFVSGESEGVSGILTGTLAYGGTGDTAQGAKNAGGYLIMPTGLSAANYAINYAPGTLTINPADLTITADSAIKVYGQTATLLDTAFTTNPNGLKNGETIGSVTLASAGVAATAAVAAGPYAITASNPIAATGSAFNTANYNITYAPGTLTVNKASLTVTANNATKLYGQTKTLTEFTSAGLQNGEAIGNVNLTSTGAAASADLAGNPYAITASNAAGGSFDASNYAITYVDGALTVNPSDPAAVALGSNALVLAYSSAQQGIAHSGMAVLDKPTNTTELISIVNCGVMMPADAPANACQN